MSPSFDDLFAERVEPLLARPDGLLPALDALEAIMPAMATPPDRADTYHWLATIHQSLAARLLAKGEIDDAKEHFEAMEEFFVKGIEEMPNRLISRLALARYYLSFGSNPGAAKEVLSPKEIPSSKDLAADALALEHQRLALLAVVYAFEGDLTRTGQQLEKAFSSEILSRMNEGVELATLEYLASRGLPFTEPMVDDITRRLRDCGFGNEERLGILKERLLRKGR